MRATRIVAVLVALMCAGTAVAQQGPLITLGRLAPSGDDSALIITRAVTGDSLFSHAIRDESVFTSTTTGAYASFDAAPTMSGATPYNHLTSFQSRPYFNGTGGIGAVYGHYFALYGTGSPSNAYGFLMEDSYGSGTPGIQVGLFVGQLSKGAANYTIYSTGTQGSYHAGLWQTGSDIVAAGQIRGASLAAPYVVTPLVRLSGEGTRPACDVAASGGVWRTPGSTVDPKTADSVAVCIWDGAGYAWKAIPLAGCP